MNVGVAHIHIFGDFWEHEGLKLKLELVSMCASQKFRLRSREQGVKETPEKQQRFTNMSHVFVTVTRIELHLTHCSQLKCMWDPG